MQIIRFELIEDHDGAAGAGVRAIVGKEMDGKIDGNEDNPVTVFDAWGVHEGHGGAPGMRGSVGYAVRMNDEERFEMLSLK